MTRSVIGNVVDLASEAGRYRPDVPSGRRAEILLKSSSLRVVLVTMRAGTASQEHSVAGSITIQGLSGVFAVGAGGEEITVRGGQLTALDEGVEHSVRCIEDGAFLLTIAWPQTGPD